MFLRFPQWQGAGPVPDLLRAVWELEPHLKDVPFTDIPVSESLISPAIDGVLGAEDLVRQLRAARAAIAAANPERIFTLGGDCSVDLAPIDHLRQRYGNELAVVWLDAHGDLNTAASSPSGHFHGMPLRMLLEGHPVWTSAPLAPQHVVLAGVRDLDPPEAHFVQQAGLISISVGAMEAPPACLAEEVAKRACRAVYVHIDLDVLDPAAFESLKCPTPAGLRLETLLAVIGHLKAQCHVVGVSVLEFTPLHRTSDVDAVLRILQAAIGDWLPSTLAKAPESR